MQKLSSYLTSLLNHGIKYNSFENEIDKEEVFSHHPFFLEFVGVQIFSETI